MQLDITPRSYKAINIALRNATSTVSFKGIWEELYTEYNIGVRIGSLIHLDASARIKIAEVIKQQVDLDPRIDHYDELIKLSRTEVSKRTRYEKLISLPPREAFVETRTLDKDFVKPGYEGMLVEDIVSLKPQCIISVENFDTFANLQRGQLSCANSFSGDDVFLIYVGDNQASPKSVQKLRDTYQLQWIHFGDYDPAGIHIGLVRLSADYLILPILEHSDFIKNSSNTKKFHQQHIQLNKIMSIKSPALKPHLDFIASNEIAVMQESLIGHEITLQVIS
tara:strand:+ start:361 stop:1200 length:840 start_codon:yes stop_codon:yes gene_type:complete